MPAVADLAAMREAVKRLGGNGDKVNPLLPTDLVIDHSVTVNAYGSKEAYMENSHLEISRNLERYTFLRWGQNAFSRFRVVPLETASVIRLIWNILPKPCGTKSRMGKRLPIRIR
ncbi:MAG: hypothetical protein GPOALKHO_000519 [Sodalis sp.]|nr:MAG: hypothetical protein GPOALKHO_000519 [Sodalis sp.]